MLSTLVVLQGAVVKGGRESSRPPLHVVGMVRRPETIGVANYLVGAGAAAPLQPHPHPPPPSHTRLPRRLRMPTRATAAVAAAAPWRGCATRRGRA